MSRGAVDDTVNSPQQGAPRLVVKYDDNAGVGQVIWVDFGLTADRMTGGKMEFIKATEQTGHEENHTSSLTPKNMSICDPLRHLSTPCQRPDPQVGNIHFRLHH